MELIKGLHRHSGKRWKLHSMQGLGFRGCMGIRKGHKPKGSSCSDMARLGILEARRRIWDSGFGGRTSLPPGHHCNKYT